MVAFFIVKNEVENYYHGEMMRNMDKDKSADLKGPKSPIAKSR